MRSRSNTSSAPRARPRWWQKVPISSRSASATSRARTMCHWSRTRRSPARSMPMSSSTTRFRRSITAPWRRSSITCSASKASSGRANRGWHFGGRMGYGRGMPEDQRSAAVTAEPALRDPPMLEAPLPGAVGAPLWMRRLGATAIVCGLLALVLLLVSLAELIGGGMARPAAITLVVLAGVFGLAAIVARQVHAALAGRLDLLSQALEASPNAHLILAPSGQVAYANAAFHRFFPDLEKPPLDALDRRFADGGGVIGEFARLRLEAAQYGRAHGRIALRYAAGNTAWFSLSAHQLAGRPGYSLWSFEDVTARHEMEQVIRDEQMKLADFLDHAPIGFYSVDGEGRFLFVNQALAEWLGVSPGELVEGSYRLKDFLATEVPPGSPAHAPFEGGAAGTPRGEVVLKGHQGRTVYA